MDRINLIIGFSNLFCAFLFIILAIPLIKGKIKMNRLYGVRIPKSFESDENWYKINRYGAKRMIIWAFPLIGISIISFIMPFYENTLVIIIFSMSPLIIFLPLIEIYYFSKKL